jgi:hypothetical protein
MKNLFVALVSAVMSAGVFAQVPAYTDSFDSTASLSNWRGGQAVVIQWNDAACTQYNSQYDYNFADPNTNQVASIETSNATGSTVLNAYSDYNNAFFQQNGCVSVNIFREYTITAADVGDYEFVVEYAFPNNPANAAESAQVFIKLLDPNNGFSDVLGGALVRQVAGSEGQMIIPVTIEDATAAGLILQYGFSNNSANYQETGVYYDNACFGAATTCDRVGGGNSSAEVDATGIPVMPLWGLLGLAGLIGFMGYRRKQA